MKIILASLNEISLARSFKACFLLNQASEESQDFISTTEGSSMYCSAFIALIASSSSLSHQGVAKCYSYSHIFLSNLPSVSALWETKLFY